MTANAQRRFILDEFFTLTLAGTVQRSGLYKEGTTEKDRKPFQDSLRKLLEEMAGEYEHSVAEEVHVANVKRLADELSAKHEDVLADGGMRIGHAQKALNLYLKYRWCLGEIPAPPHCPLDSIVLGQVPGCETVRWTRMKTIDEYRDAIAKVRLAAGEQSLAQWELENYGKR
ncbi:MAG: hypothetical protein FJ222_07540 [Lentisphaerae bacterium]|nr:hypothetical protein [Lentisphaerota bacterium]